VISSRPAIIRSVVVLPHPEGPRSTTNSPSWMESDTSLTASTVSNFLLRFSKSNLPNGCPPRLLPAIWELWGQGAEKSSALFPARLLFVSQRPESIGSGPFMGAFQRKMPGPLLE